MKLTKEKTREIEKELNDILYSLMPEGIEGEIGVGKFRTTFHRIYIAGDGWMMGGKSIYVIMEVMGKLIKLSKDLDTYNDKWMVHHTSGGASPLDLNQEEIFGHKIRNAEVTRKAREGGYLDSLLR